MKRHSNSALCLLAVVALVVPHARASSIHVPDDYATIQEAVDNAFPGDLILVLGGDYVELVEVHVEGITIRAVAGATLTGSFVISADRVSVENWYVTTA